MPSIGERLREARESRGRDLDQIAAEIRIQARYLKAIEAGDLTELPGGFFARSFVRQYAKHLEMPETEIEQDLERWLSTEFAEGPPSLEPKIMDTGLPPVAHVGRGRRPRRKVLGALAGLVVVIGACAAVYAYWMQRQETAEIASVTPERAEVAASGEDTVAGLEAETAAVAADRPTPAGGGEPDEAAVEPAAAPGAPGSLSFEMTATEETWVRVRSGAQTLFAGILQPGESRQFSGLEAATLRTGNAGGLNLRVNGGRGQLVGPRGHIRDVELAPGSVVISAPPAPRPEGEREAGIPESDP